MKQKLSKDELKDVVDVMVCTRMHQNPRSLLKSQNVKYALILGFGTYIIFGTTASTMPSLSKVMLVISVFSFLFAAYVWSYLRGLKKNVRKMIEKRIGDPISVSIDKTFVRYNGTNIPWRKIERIIEYKSLYFCVFGQNFIVLKAQPELNKVIESVKDTKYMKYKRPFTLF